MSNINKKRINNAIHDAELAFWDVIAENFPEITTGDVLPEHLVEMHCDYQKHVTRWIKLNHSDPHFLDNVNFDCKD